MANEHMIVINDDALYLDMMHEILTDEGFRMTRCATSASAGGVVEQIQPAAVILDLRMERPDSGVAVLQQLRDNPRTAHIPVVMLTRHDQAADTLKGLEVGPDDYIPKDNFAEHNLVQSLRHLSIV